MKKLFIVLIAFLTLCAVLPGSDVIQRETAKLVSEIAEKPSGDDLLVFEKTLEEAYVKVVAERGVLPEDAELVVIPVAEDSPEYQQTMEIMDRYVLNETVNLVFDIHFLDRRSGEIIEPSGDVDVVIDVSSTLVSHFSSDLRAEDFLVYHITQDDELEIIAEATDFLPGSVSLETASSGDLFIHAAFSTDSFSAYTITWTNAEGAERTATVHYGYMRTASNGSEYFREINYTLFNRFEPNILPEESPNYLIYDIRDYEFSYAYIPETDGRALIQPFLKYEKSFGTYQFYYIDEDGSESSAGLTNGKHIYMVYTQKPDPVSGGSASSQIPVFNLGEDVSILKESIDNEDGTRTISLSVKGRSEIRDADKLADVIIIMDVSGSMKNGMDGKVVEDEADSRMAQAKNAVEWFCDKLLSQEMTNSQGEPLCRVSFVTFSNVATDWSKGMSTDLADVESLLDTLQPDGGTNWEHALQLANRMAVDPERDTFVIFVTDGDPTWRMTRYKISDNNLRNWSDVWTDNDGLYYRRYGVFGAGNKDSLDFNWSAALAEAQSIVNLGKHLYSIAISSDVTKLDNFTVQAGEPAGHCFSIDNEEELMSAFADIYDQISSRLGYVNIRISDGITPLTDLTAKTPVEGLDSADCFKYYKKSPDDVNYLEWDPASEGVNYASYNSETGAVEWDFGQDFMLDDETEYKVEFLVWPSQEAFDIITQLNNGEIAYDSLDQDIKDQIGKLDDEFYYLKTNIDPTCKYQHGYHQRDGIHVYEGDYTLEYNDVDPLKMKSMSINVRKLFADTLTAGEDRQEIIHLTLQSRAYGSDNQWEDVHEFVLNDGNSFTGSYEISPGLITAHGEERIEYNPGYEYRVIEENIDYHYELNAEILRPILVNLYDEVYEGDADKDGYLTAENTVKGGLNISKTVVDDAGNPIIYKDYEYVIKGYILDPEGNGYTFNTEWDTRTDVSGKEGASDEWIEHQDDTGAYHIIDSDGNRIGYKMHFADTAEIELHLKAGMRIRFINLPAGSTYYFYEETTGLPVDVSFLKIEGSNLTVDEDDAYTSEGVTQPVVSEGTVSGTIYGNVMHNVIVYNQAEATTFTASKKWKNADGSTTSPSNASVCFRLMNGEEVVGDYVLNGQTTGQRTEQFTYKDCQVTACESSEWTVTFTCLPKFDEEGEEITYTVREYSCQPEGYIADADEVGNNGVITNTYNLTDIEVIKVWDDDDDKDQIRPASVTVALCVGEEILEEVTLDTESGWSHIFEGYPILDENREEIEYSIREIEVPEDYTVSCSGKNYSFTVTNTHTTVPDTGDRNPLTMWAVVAGEAMVCMLLMLLFDRKRKKEEQLDS